MAFHANDPLFAPMLGAFVHEDDESSTDTQSADEDIFAPLDFVNAFAASETTPPFVEFGASRMMNEALPLPMAPIQATTTRKRKEAPTANEKSEPKNKCANRMTPEEKARRKLERQIARRQRKSIREKERRNNVNQLFDQVATMLGLPKEGSDRRTILAKTIDTLIQCGIPAPPTNAAAQKAAAK